MKLPEVLELIVNCLAELYYRCFRATLWCKILFCYATIPCNRLWMNDFYLCTYVSDLNSQGGRSQTTLTRSCPLFSTYLPNPFWRNNMHTVDISSTTYLSRLVNVVCECPKQNLKRSLRCSEAKAIPYKIVHIMYIHIMISLFSSHFN